MAIHPIFLFFISGILADQTIFTTLDTALYEAKQIERPWWSGSVKIQYHNSTIDSVHAIIIPMKTSGRSKPPSPLFGNIDNAQSKKLHKGHVLALQLGGPDKSENIVAQNGAWNAYGAWRHLENYLHHLSRHVMGFSKEDQDYSYNKNPADYEPPKMCIDYLIMPTNYDKKGEPKTYYGQISILRQGFVSKTDGEQQTFWKPMSNNNDFETMWNVAKQFNFTINSGHDTKWIKEAAPDWVQYKTPKQRTSHTPIWKHFGTKTKLLIDELSPKDATFEQFVHRKIEHGVDDDNSSSLSALERKFKLKDILLWGTIYTLLLLCTFCSCNILFYKWHSKVCCAGNRNHETTNMI